MKVRYLITLLLIGTVLVSYGQTIQQTNKDDLPSTLNFKGKINKAFQWDSNGETNYLVFSTTGEYKSYPEIKDSISAYVDGYPVLKPEYEMRSSEYFFYYYRAGELQWKIYDYVKECRFDIRFRFIADAFKVTDLDNDGLNEIWVMYSLSCTSDVSPDNLKLIMYEGDEKYAIRGFTRQYEQVPTKAKDSPKTISNAFENGGTGLKEFAMKLWEKNNQYSVAD